MNILEILSEQLNNKEILDKLGESVGVSSDQAKNLTSLGLPALVQALGRNICDQQGASEFETALTKHRDDNVEDILGFLGNVDRNDGAKILQHIFTGNNEKIQTKLAEQTGMNEKQVAGIMSQLAPLLMGAMGQQRNQQNLDASGIFSLLNGFMGKSDLTDKVTQMLDADGDGNVMDDVSGLLGKFLKK